MEKFDTFCVKLASFLILVNGSPAGFFGGSRGLRQGDPLSLFLFIMVSEVLSKMVKKTEMGYMSGFRVGRGEVSILHLQFADDTIIFCECKRTANGIL